MASEDGGGGSVAPHYDVRLRRLGNRVAPE